MVLILRNLILRTHSLFTGFFSVFRATMSENGASVNSFVRLFRLLRRRVTGRLTQRFTLANNTRLQFGVVSYRFSIVKARQAFFRHPRRSTARFLFVGQFARIITFCGAQRGRLHRFGNNRAFVARRALPATTCK